jgi:ADP-ribosylglycohydrolase
LIARDRHAVLVQASNVASVHYTLLDEHSDRVFVRPAAGLGSIPLRVIVSRLADSIAARYRGAVIGQCVGDALGFVVEGHPPRQCRDYVDQVVQAGRATSVGRGRFPFGQYSDDSQLLRELLASFVDRRHFDPADYARRIAAIFAEDRVVGRGRATEEAARRLAAGTAWDQAGAPPPAAGNGSAMRAAGAGLIAPRGGAELARVAHDQGRITHADPRCSAGAIAVAAAVARGLRGETPDPTAFCTEMAELAAPFDRRTAELLAELPAWVALHPDQAVAPIAALGSAPEVGAVWPGISPYVVPSVLWSLYSFLRTPGDYMATVCTAIAVGGDVDTTAAMAGAISGAHLGVGAIPVELAACVNDQGTWATQTLSDLADRVRALAAL